MKILKILETASPQLIPQNDLTMGYVNKWKSEAEKALRIGRNITQHKMKEARYVLHRWAKSSASGVWFITLDGKSVDFIYAYQSIRLDKSGKHKAAEALAFNFTKNKEPLDPGRIVGVMRGIFFDHLLPDLKFVVTDFMYTPDGLDWFGAEYETAFGRGYKVYAIDLTGKPKVEQISQEQFFELQPLYWGKDKLHQKYRFAIELP